MSDPNQNTTGGGEPPDSTLGAGSPGTEGSFTVLDPNTNPTHATGVSNSPGQDGLSDAGAEEGNVSEASLAQQPDHGLTHEDLPRAAYATERFLRFDKADDPVDIQLKIKALRQAIHEDRLVILGLEDLIVEGTNTMSQQSIALTDMTSKRDELSSQCQSVKDQLSQLQTTSTNMTDELATATSECSSLKARLQLASEASTTVTQERDRLKARVSDLESTRTDLLSQVQSATQLADTRAESISSHVRTLDELNRQLGEAKSKVSTGEMCISDLNTTINRLRTTNTRLESDVTELNTRVNTLSAAPPAIDLSAVDPPEGVDPNLAYLARMQSSITQQLTTAFASTQRSSSSSTQHTRLTGRDVREIGPTPETARSHTSAVQRLLALDQWFDTVAADCTSMFPNNTSGKRFWEQSFSVAEKEHGRYIHLSPSEQVDFVFQIGIPPSPDIEARWYPMLFQALHSADRDRIRWLEKDHPNYATTAAGIFLSLVRAYNGSPSQREQFHQAVHHPTSPKSPKLMLAAITRWRQVLRTSDKYRAVPLDFGILGQTFVAFTESADPLSAQFGSDRRERVRTEGIMSLKRDDSTKFYRFVEYVERLLHTHGAAIPSAPEAKAATAVGSPHDQSQAGEQPVGPFPATVAAPVTPMQAFQSKKSAPPPPPAGAKVCPHFAPTGKGCRFGATCTSWHDRSRRAAPFCYECGNEGHFADACPLVPPALRWKATGKAKGGSSGRFDSPPRPKGKGGGGGFFKKVQAQVAQQLSAWRAEVAATAAAAVPSPQLSVSAPPPLPVQHVSQPYFLSQAAAASSIAPPKAQPAPSAGSAFATAAKAYSHAGPPPSSSS